MGEFNNYVNSQKQVGGQSIVYVYNIDGPFLIFQGCLLGGGWVAKKGQNSVYIVIEWPLAWHYTAWH